MYPKVQLFALVFRASINRCGNTQFRPVSCLRLQRRASSHKQFSFGSLLRQRPLILQNVHQVSYRPPPREKNKSTMMLVTAIVVLVLGLSYAAVPLYRIYCQKTGKGGQAILEANINERVASMRPVEGRKVKVVFEAEKSSRLAWNFKPTQPSVTCSPGETVLAFYTAKNVLDRPVNGIATYNILPYEAGKYFQKIQCFCFEEQQLNANEEVDLPVFFYIDPEFSRDPYLYECEEIILSYNFFETKEGYKLPMPPGYRAHLPTSSLIVNANQTSS